MNISQHQLELLNHTLGIRPDMREPYRNHFVAGPGHHDQDDLDALEKLGLMAKVKPPSFCADGDIVFICTDTGKDYAIRSLPKPKKRSKYDEYLHSEYSGSFAEYLGIDIPRVEYDYSGNYRYSRNGRYTKDGYLPGIAGEWRKTKKEAKASYKLALNRGNQ